MEPLISGVAQLSWDLLNHGAGFYPIFYNPNPISKPNTFDNPLPLSKPNRFHNRKHKPKPSLNLRIRFFEVLGLFSTLSQLSFELFADFLRPTLYFAC